LDTVEKLKMVPQTHWAPKKSEDGAITPKDATANTDSTSHKVVDIDDRNTGVLMPALALANSIPGVNLVIVYP
jgi:hypothetical protein